MSIQGRYIEDDRLFALAEQTARLNRKTEPVPAKALVSKLNSAVRDIDAAYEKVEARFGSAVNIPVACEWLLDNRYIAKREAKCAIAAFSKEKSLRGSDVGAILLEMCKTLVACGLGKVTEERCRLFLDGFQSVSVLPRKELYLFPAALRAALILRLAELCEKLLKTNTPEQLTDGIAAVFTSLRLVGGLDMQYLLESVDVSEKLLCSDPSGIYPKMDDLSRAYYRERLSHLAKANSMEEHYLAKHILKLCTQSEGDARHVGYYLFTKPLGKDEKKCSGALYIATNVLLTLFLTILCGFLSHSFIAAVLLLLPISELTKNLLDYLILLAVPPRRMLRLELKDGVGDDAKTVCVISALLSDKDSGQKLARRIEEFYLTNRRCGKNLMFGILADLPEAACAVTENDAPLMQSAADAVNRLNEKYGSSFYLFTRPRTEDAGRHRFCGFERKRGAVLALAAMLCGKKSELVISTGDGKRLEGAKYIVTLDSDTNPTPDSISELIGAITHPLNKPKLDRENACVTAGHGIIHPRMNYELSSVGKTDFSRIFAGVGGTEPYSVLCGELYTDLFDAGGFSGKGIIDAEALYVCSNAHIPDGLVLSHDALEGAYLRGGYMSDTEFTDSFPSTPIAYYRRSHRWIRGDWQNSGWIFSRDASMTDIERFKLFDSLRRSLVAPLSFAAIFLGLLLSGHALMLAAWTALLALGARLLIALTEFGTSKSSDSHVKYQSRLFKGVSAALIQTVLRLWFLPYEAWICLSAAAVSLWRMGISRKNLLEWETAAQSERKKRSVASYCLNMWFAPISGLALLIFSTGIFAKTVGLLWIVAPLAALALTFPAKPVKVLPADKKAYLSECAESIWAYFDKFCTAEDNFLPPDNYQEQPPVGIAHRTSPTNIGLALVSALCAVDLGIDKAGRAFEIIEKMLTTLEKMPKFYGHLCNWYDTRTLRCLEPKYISTVDSGNLYACLLTLKNGLYDYNRTHLARRVEKLMEPMDFSVLFDKNRKLFYIGLDLEKSKASDSYYDLMASEARLTSYLAVAKGDVPRSHWRRLSRAMRSYAGYQGMASWTGTMFEYLMPELFLPLVRDSLMYETAKYCMFVQKHRQTHSKLWGISESAFFSLDPALNYRYKAHGCAHLALKRGQDSELVISPYSSFLALNIEPFAAVSNLRRLDSAGAKGRYGFIEAIDFTPSRCRNADGEPVRCYMAHHLGMSMLSIANCLSDGIVKRRFMADARMHAYRCLLEEKLPVNATVLKLGEGGFEKPQRIAGQQWAKRGEDIDFENPGCAVLSNGIYNVMLTESGVSASSCGEMLVYKPPFRQLGEGHGFEIRLEYGDRSYSLLPEPGAGDFIWELNEMACSYTLNADDFILKSSVATAGGENGELRFAEVSAKRDIESARLCFSFEPVLADYNDYVNHPAYWRLGIDAHSDGNCLVLHRLARGRQHEVWLCIACDRKMNFQADRNGDYAHLSAPFVSGTTEFSLKEGERVETRFAMCVAFTPDEAYAGAQHMLAIGPSEFGAMPSACASLTGMDSREMDLAMSMIKQLWFRTAEKPFISKQKLWQYGVSGDMPIIVCPSDEVSRETAESLTKQFCLLRSCGVFADLVFLTDEGGEYRRPIYGCVRDILASHGLEALIGTHGGIRILPVSAQADILAAASVIIGAESSGRRTDCNYQFPFSEPRKPDCIPKFNYGAENSFIFYVNRSLPPKVWSNILTNGSFGYYATDCGMGNMWLKNSREMRVNRWVNDPYAVHGPETLEFITPNGRYSIFAASDGTPCRVHYGFGYAVWEKSFGSTGIRCTAFVPCGVDARLLIIEVCGSVTGQIAWKTELQLSGSEDDYLAVNSDYVNSMFIASSSRFVLPELKFKALCSAPILGWTCDLFSWLRGDYDGKTAELSAPIFGAVFNCQPVSVIACGFCDDSKLMELCKPENAFNALDSVKAAWRREVTKLEFIGNVPFEHYMNGWAVYQTLACRLMGRCSVYQSGGATGFRDQLQDAVNLLLISPVFARRQILDCCAHQYIEGDVMHWWHALPDGDKGVRTRCSDDMLWLVWALCEYVEKTGDTGICSELVYYVNSAPLEAHENDRYEAPLRSEASASVLDHAKAAVDCCANRGVGVHGLLFFGSGDWNDGMDKIGGESVWLSWFFAHTVKRFADLLVMLCKQGSDRYRALAAACGNAADKAWDGSWYLRGYWPDGEPIGAKGSECCRIDSIVQSWAAMCSDASNSRIDMALDSAVSALYDRESKLVKLFTPPFYGCVRDPGYVQSYGPGFRENGGQYTHAAIWLAMACLRRGRSKDGYGILCDLIPETHDLKRYMAEPFVIPADVYTCPDHMGEAGWTWYTGSSAWYFRVVCEELLGLRLWSGALYIRPTLPEGFPDCSVKWTNGSGKVYDIVISTEGVTLDGEKYDGKGIPYN